jgi:divalent metal cation (Fe/Co/Zn/Cd) transporter
MSTIDNDQITRLESRAMVFGMVGNLAMGAGGVLAAHLSRSDAVLVDGMFSLIGFAAAFVGRKVARNAQRAPDKYRPFGYEGDEAIFVMFRSLSLLGLVLFALVGAGMNILRYLGGEQPPELVMAPLMVYFLFVGVTCVGLWGFHRWSWSRTGKRSELLLLESKAAAFDGLITAAAAVGLLGIHVLRDGVLAPIAPIGDSLIVLVLCSVVVFQYFKAFVAGVGELAGVSAGPQFIASARREIRQTLQEDGGVLHDLSVSKLGRTFTVVIYYDPARPMRANEVDTLADTLETDLQRSFADVRAHVVISEYGRSAQMPKIRP